MATVAPDPKPGETPNLGPDRATPGAPIACLTLCSVAFLIVCLRMYTRLFVKRAAGWDDLLIVLSMALGIAFVPPQMIQIYKGEFGHHRYLTPQYLINIQAPMNTVLNIISAFSLMCSRGSIIVFLLRIIGDIRRWAITLWSTMALNIVVAVGTTIIYLVLCFPLRKEWDKKVPGHCMDKEIFDDIVRLFTALSCLVDFTCALVPFIAMQHVRIDRRTKMGVFAILGCGIITASCGIGRAVSLNFNSTDTSWVLVPMLYWQFAEMYGAIIFASLPALRQLVTHWQTYGTFLPTVTGSSVTYGSGTSRVHTRHASTPATLVDHDAPMTQHGMGNKGMDRHEVGRQTDVYVELNDLETGSVDGFAEGHNGLNSNGLVVDENGLVRPRYPMSRATAEVPRVGRSGSREYRRGR